MDTTTAVAVLRAHAVGTAYIEWDLWNVYQVRIVNKQVDEMDSHSEY